VDAGLTGVKLPCSFFSNQVARSPGFLFVVLAWMFGIWSGRLTWIIYHQKSQGRILCPPTLAGATPRDCLDRPLLPGQPQGIASTARSCRGNHKGLPLPRKILLFGTSLRQVKPPNRAGWRSLHHAPSLFTQRPALLRCPRPFQPGSRSLEPRLLTRQECIPTRSVLSPQFPHLPLPFVVDSR